MDEGKEVYDTTEKINDEIRRLWGEYDFTNCSVLGYLVEASASDDGDSEWRKRVYDRLKLWSN